MPGLKRAVPTEAPALDEEDEVAQTDSREHQKLTNRKRLRLSDVNDQDDDSDETDEETRTWQATQYHEQQKMRDQRENVPAENGIIESITMANFMCHSFLKVDIGPLINFIIGHNGSGKSAVLTALTVCLGGKASATNRASSLKHFIKAGTDSCTLSVKIKNTGETGYQPDLYGDSITVERHFTTHGQSSWKIKGGNGRIISTKRGDLEDISDYFALQLDNPISVLTQDNSRQFLSSSSPSDKYKFFIKGVQLEQLNQDYDLLHESINQMENTFEDKKLHVGQLKEKTEKTKAIFDLMNQQQNIRQEIEKLKVQMAWVQVEVEEEELRNAHQHVQSLETNIEAAQGAAERAGDEYASADEAKEAADGAKRNVQTELDTINEELSNTKEKHGAARREANEAQQDQRAIADQIKSHDQEIEKTKKEIESEKQRLEEINGGSIARRLAELESKKLAIEEAKQKQREHQESRESITSDEKQVSEEHQALVKKREAREGEKSSCNERLRSLRQQGAQRSFVQNMDKLIKAVNAERGWREKPVGPIGNYVQLTEPQWLSVLERTFGGSLNGFIVTSKADQDKLSSLARQVQCQAPVFIGNHQPLDTSNHEPDAQFATALRVINISSELVRKQLIINQNIEQTVLVESQQEARTLMRQRPRLSNVKQILSLQQHKRGAGDRFTFGMGDSVNSSFIAPWQGLPRMKTQAEDAIAFEENQYQRLQRERASVDDELKALAQRRRAVDQARSAHDKAGQALKIGVQRAEQARDELQNTIDADTVEEGRLDALNARLEEAEGEKAHHENLYGDAVENRNQQLQRLREAEREVKEAEGRARAHERRLREAAEAVREAAEERQARLQAKNAAITRGEGLRSELQARCTERDSQEEVVREFCEKAGDIGARVPVGRGETFASIERKLTKLEADIRAHEARLGGSREKVVADYEGALKSYQAALAQLRSEEELSRLLKQTLQTRRERWRLFRRKICARARATFVHVLSERSFHGRLLIDHRGRRLDIDVQPEAAQRGEKGRAASGLSGGEKSYATICLLLSLWDAVGAPIRCLDEFDVYMDSVNRDISMKLLVRAARHAIGRQFIFISPQAGVVDGAPDVRVHRLRDPERNAETQTRLPFGEGTQA